MNDHLFKVKDKIPKLPESKAEKFPYSYCSMTFLYKLARPYISPTIAYLTTKDGRPNENDWDQLVRLMQYLNHTKNEWLTLSLWWQTVMWMHHLHWYADNTGISPTFGKGFQINISWKQSFIIELNRNRACCSRLCNGPYTLDETPPSSAGVWLQADTTPRRHEWLLLESNVSRAQGSVHTIST